MTKKYLLGIVLSILFIISTSHAGSWNGWIYQNPYPTANTLLAVKFITPQKGWVVGEKGTILYTEDGGDTWEAQESGTEEDLKSVAFVNEKQGWAVGNRGVIIHTEDGGKTWKPQGDIKIPLHKVFFVTEKEGWAGGDHGTLLHTIDGGQNWVKPDIGKGISASIGGIFFIDSNTGWILAGGKVYRTIDTGKTWQGTTGMVGGGPSGFTEISEKQWQGEIFFANDKQGWAVVGLWYIYHTEDGGKTWEDQLSTGYMSYGVGNIFFTNDKNGCAAGSSILCTEDGGKTWNERLGIKPGERDNIGDVMVSVWGISFVNRSTAWAVGNNGQIIKTEDGGKSWKLKTSIRIGYAYFIDAKTGWSYRNDKSGKDYKGYLLKTEDGGDTWQEQKEFENRVVLRFYFVNPTTGWAVGSEWGSTSGGSKLLSLFILHTNDGGKTWITQFKEQAGKKWGFIDGLFDVFFINSNVGWVVGSRGLIFYTEDGGKHWEQQKSGTKLNFGRVEFVDAKRGWVVGFWETEGSVTIAILHTEDGGKNWHKQWEKRGGWMALDEMFFLDKNNGWVVGDITPYSGDGILLHTTDGGKTWLENSGSEFKKSEFRYPFFLDTNRGVILTHKGLMLKTKDGGKTWSKQSIPLRKYPWHVSDIFKKDGDIK